AKTPDGSLRATSSASAATPTTAASSELAPPSASTDASRGSVASGGGSSSLSDDALRAAVRSKEQVLVVRVTKAQQGATGSGSESRSYDPEVVRAVLGDAKGRLQLVHYGPPELTAGKSYVVTTRGGPPLDGGKWIRDHSEVPAGKEDEYGKT